MHHAGSLFFSLNSTGFMKRDTLARTCLVFVFTQQPQLLILVHANPPVLSLCMLIPLYYPSAW